MAQDAPPPAQATDVPVIAASNAGRSVYVPADFQRFAPRNAYDMLLRVPGFAIKESQERRGLGQATGNVLFNGARPSNKSDDLFTQLSRIPAGTVERIEVLDGASLDIPGLSGQVANVVYKAKGSTGQFEWEPAVRAHYADALYTRGNVSLTGSKGTIGYELSLDNQEAGRSAAGGPTLIRDGIGVITERRRDVWTSNHDAPKLSARFTWDGPGTSVAHLNGNYQKVWHHYREASDRSDSPVLSDRRRTIRENNDTWNYEVSGDYEFALGPGRLKLVGLEHRSHEPFSSEVIDTPLGAPASATGDRFAQVGDLEETIARAEYTWKMLGADFQLSGEAAYNTLDNVATLGTFDAVSGDFVLRPFAEGTGGVKEDRYESLLSVGFPLTRTLSLQMVAGGEHSTISQTGPGGITRTFDRPKGSISMAWKPSSDFDLSVKLERRVLQLDFYDFLARSFLNDNNQNASNTDLRPQQDWSWTAEANKKLGPWGSTKLELIHRDVTDRVDIIPVGLTGEAVGNIDKASAWAVVSTSTINFDPMGWKGARLDASIVYQHSSLKDPFTGRTRNWNNFVDKQVQLDFRHDVPATNWAWGASASYNHQQAEYRRSQSDRIWEGPVFAALFVENKDVMGLTMRFTIDNVVNARSRRERVIYQGVRELSPVASTESRDRLIGPIFIFLVKGSF
ncbi:TonB-dependent siderophore receptor [Novosphingobium sp. 9U]|uniref:TonB-dependent receptor plug domain-containing protein n=1 Tax=Novosphingobium sp. 9U TaxID=2653158 RepID=UPI001F3110CF|nr:TonB-dependent receptor plug domain-containing protein [Novosphingobium sp. 9U]